MTVETPTLGVSFTPSKDGTLACESARLSQTLGPSPNSPNQFSIASNLLLLGSAKLPEHHTIISNSLLDSTLASPLPPRKSPEDNVNDAASILIDMNMKDGETTTHSLEISTSSPSGGSIDNPTNPVI
jgi:hypothetical protein